jgi:hypothetical protein
MNWRKFLSEIARKSEGTALIDMNMEHCLLNFLDSMRISQTDGPGCRDLGVCLTPRPEHRL